MPTASLILGGVILNSNKTLIQRKPLKLKDYGIVRRSIVRRPIQRDHCTCEGLQVIQVNGNPWLVNGDKIPYEVLKNLINSINVCPSFYFSEPLVKSINKIKYLTEQGVGVIVSLREIPSEKFIRLVSKNIFNYLWMHIQTDDLGVFTCEEDKDARELYKFLYRAKLHGTFVGLELEILRTVPHFLNTLEFIDLCRNFITAVFFRRGKPLLESDRLQSSLQDGLSQQAFLDQLVTFLGYKKIPLEDLGSKFRNGYTRLDFTSKFSIPTYYKREDGLFTWDSKYRVEEKTCTRCSKTRFS